MDSTPSSPERRRPTPLQFLYQWAGNIARERGVVDSQYESNDPEIHESEVRRNLLGELARNYRYETPITPTEQFEATELIIDYSEEYEVDHEYTLPDTIQVILRYPYGAKKTIFLMREAEDDITGAIDIETDESVDLTSLSRKHHDKLFALMHHFNARLMLQRGATVLREDMDEVMYALGQL